jgi:hypothetical protein
MKNLRTAFIRLAHENPETRSTLLPLLKRADKWETMPKGWTDESRKEFWETLTGDVKHKVTKCIKEMEGKFDDPGAFCASLADRVDPGWRSRQANLVGDRPMSDRDLRSIVIRLAHAKPELRTALLPLVKEAAVGVTPKTLKMIQEEGPESDPGSWGILEEYDQHDPKSMDLKWDIKNVKAVGNKSILVDGVITLNLTYEFEWGTQFDAEISAYKKLIAAALADLKKA